MNSEAVTETQNNGATTGLIASNVQKLRSLVISPDLDKLLEHEEKLRSSRTTTTPIISTACSLTEVEQPTGLPPPPRRNRQPPSRTGLQSISRPATGMLSVVAEQEENTPRSSTPNLKESPVQRNPYINPAPTAEELFRSRDSVLPASQQSLLPLQQNPSVYRNAKDTPAICFKVETPKKGNFPEPATPGQTSPTLMEKHHYPDHDSLISHGQMSEDGAIAMFASSSVEFQARIGIARTVNRPSRLDDHHSTLPDGTLDPTTHRLSFIEIYSQATTRSNPSPLSPQMSESSPDSTNHPVTPKPPLPPTPKPVFTRRPSLLMKQSFPRSPVPQQGTGIKPITTNLLDLDERAELVRKSRKLSRVFGETPNAEAVVNQDIPRSAIRRKGRVSQTQPCHERITAQLPARRYSLPLSSDDVSFISISPASEEDKLLSSAFPPHMLSSTPLTLDQESTPIRSHSPSFIDLSDDGSSAVDNASPPETASIEDRRRKRDRLAKLHWFLGSQVPANLVLGLVDDTAAPLPPLLPVSSQRRGMDVDGNRRKPWVTSRRSSSVIVSPSDMWPDGLDRMKTNLDEKEKAIIVRRKQKMEKVFGVAPPIALYHTSIALPSSGARSAPSWSFPSSMGLSSVPLARMQKKKESRPTTPESSKYLLKGGASVSSANRSLANESSNISNSSSGDHGHSFYYSHYAQSLNSLSSILDRDDVAASLAELHQVLSCNISTPVCPSQSDDEDGATTPMRRDDPSVATLSIKSERLRSFPAKASQTSLNSGASVAIPSPKLDAGSFQQRRKKAAKLTQFFGVDYRELIDNVLESIENGMQVDQRDGMLRAEEVEDLLQKLRKLKHKRRSFV